MKIFLPYRAEFGFIVMVHAPQVNYCSQHHTCIVCCECGNEALYPEVAAYYYVGRRNDIERRQFLEHDFMNKIKSQLCIAYKDDNPEFMYADEKAPRAYFIPTPHQPLEIKIDIVICPRWREYGSDKNWPHWQALADGLSQWWNVFAAGAPDSSCALKTDSLKGRSWDYNRYLDATIAAMLSARLVIATDSGLAHLAVLCGKPLLLISHKNGLVAPGHDDVGNEYWPIRIKRYERANHCNQPIDILHDSWNDPGKVIDKTRRLLCES